MHYIHGFGAAMLVWWYSVAYLDIRYQGDGWMDAFNKSTLALLPALGAFLLFI